MGQFEREKCHDWTHVLKGSLVLLCDKGSPGAKAEMWLVRELVAIITIRQG